MLLAAAKARISGVQLAREVVLDPVDAQPLGVAGADLAHEGEVVAAASARAQASAQPVGVHVVGTEDVARAVTAAERRALPLGALAFGPAAAGVGRRLIGPIWSKLITTPSVGRLLIERDHPGGLGLVVGVRAGLPGARALEGQAGRGQDPTQVRRGDLDDLLPGADTAPAV